MKSIAFFNNKGGVGKTTLLCNLAAYLAKEKSRKVLVIDADPQCNATQSMFSDKIIEGLYEHKDSFTIYSVAHPLSIGRGYTEQIQPLASAEFGVDVIPGDPRLALTEDLLATDWTRATSGDTRGLRTTYLFSELLARLTQYDYVLFDMGPSLGSINRAVLVACDFFLSPMSIDIFSLRAIENISTALSKWKTQLNHGLAQNEHPEELPIQNPSWDIKFLGYVTQQYKAKTDGFGNVIGVNAYERIKKRVPTAVTKEFIRKLQPNIKKISYDLGGVPNLHSLVPLSQDGRKPIFSLKAKDGVVGAHFAKVKASKTIFAQIADNLEKNVVAIK
ncbi:MAG: AAA family ATPase [Parvibaculum sp.]|uniref:ParA family protein n=1 Tax=Parvibaculum sp. TaxID=2024848 RepID=UPI0025F6612B|nr:AAA family ATPase [Parvibaculum sp.]MCE9651102.1 AAA family ATPase [Parvibaculum sp.]